jgi:hypothetical protein
LKEARTAQAVSSDAAELTNLRSAPRARSHAIRDERLSGYRKPTISAAADARIADSIRAAGAGIAIKVAEKVLGSEW